MNQQRHRVHRIRNMIAVLLAAFGIITVSATAASATAASATAAIAKHECSSGTYHVICFSITKVDSDLYDVHVGIDIKMSRADAEAIIAQSGDPVDAWAMGDDPFYDNAEFRVPLSWVAAGEEGLSSEFDTRVPYAALDEDSDGRDELYARVRLFDDRTPQIRTFTSPTLSSPF